VSDIHKRFKKFEGLDEGLYSEAERVRISLCYWDLLEKKNPLFIPT